MLSNSEDSVKPLRPKFSGQTQNPQSTCLPTDAHELGSIDFTLAELMGIEWAITSKIEFLEDHIDHLQEIHGDFCVLGKKISDKIGELNKQKAQ